jgi:hypothetical protein
MTLGRPTSDHKPILLDNVVKSTVTKIRYEDHLLQNNELIVNKTDATEGDKKLGHGFKN